jgi:hypothetical protein
MNTTAASLLESRAMQHSNQEIFNNSRGNPKIIKKSIVKAFLLKI